MPRCLSVAVLGFLIATPAFSSTPPEMTLDYLLKEKCSAENKALFEKHQKLYLHENSREGLGQIRTQFDIPRGPVAKAYIEQNATGIGASYEDYAWRVVGGQIIQKNKQSFPRYEQRFITWRFDRKEIPFAARLFILDSSRIAEPRVGTYLFREDCAWEFNSYNFFVLAEDLGLIDRGTPLHRTGKTARIYEKADGASETAKIRYFYLANDGLQPKLEKLFEWATPKTDSNRLIYLRLNPAEGSKEISAQIVAMEKTSEKHFDLELKEMKLAEILDLAGITNLP